MAFVKSRTIESCWVAVLVVFSEQIWSQKIWNYCGMREQAQLTSGMRHGGLCLLLENTCHLSSLSTIVHNWRAHSHYRTPEYNLGSPADTPWPDVISWHEPLTPCSERPVSLLLQKRLTEMSKFDCEPTFRFLKFGKWTRRLSWHFKVHSADRRLREGYSYHFFYVLVSFAAMMPGTRLHFSIE